jgi:UDP-glucose 4-epimerase
VKIFVTGGAGFIGSALTRELLAGGHELVIYDDLSRGKNKNVPPDAAVELVIGDVRDRSRVRAAIVESAPDRVVHLAGLHFIPHCVAHPTKTMAINVEGTRHVLDACTAARVTGVVLASSAAVYAPGDAPCRETDSPLGPTDVYGESKLRAEQLANEFYVGTGIGVTALRIFNAVGPRETNPHLVPHILESLRTGDTVSLGNVKTRRDYVDTRDIATAIVTAARTSAGWRVFNVGTGVAYSASEIVEILRAKLRRSIVVRTDPARLRPTDRDVLVASVSKMREELGFAPRFSLSDSLSEAIDDFALRPSPPLEPSGF